MNLTFMKRVITMTVLNELDSTCGISDEELTQRFKEANTRSDCESSRLGRKSYSRCNFYERRLTDVL